MTPEAALVAIKLVHTIVWGVMVAVILAIPWFVARERWRTVVILISIVLVECTVVAVNGMRCPLTDVAAHYTADRAPNFDIYLPVWLAAKNKLIFGSLFGLELGWAALKYRVRWRA